MQGQLEYQEHPMLLMPRDFEVQNVTRRPPWDLLHGRKRSQP